MPQIRFPANYPLPQAQTALLDDPNALPDFDPTQPDTVSAGDPTPIPASPTNASEAESANTVALPPLNGDDSKRKIKMAPTRNGTPPPPVDEPPQLPPQAETPSPAAAAGAPTEPPTGPPPPDMAAALTPKSDEPKTTSEKLAALSPPDAPNSNWAQRLANAVLSFTKFAPMANQIIHPKWSEQARAYQGTRAALEAQQGEEETAAKTTAETERAEAYAAQKNAQAASYAQTQDTRKAQAQDRLKAAFEKTMGPNAVQLGPGEQVPQGFTPFTDPTDPNSVWVRRSPIVNAPKELLPYLPGIKEGQPITQGELDGAFKAAQAEHLENVRAGNKPDKENEQQWIADSTNPDPAISGPAKQKLKQAQVQHAAEHPTIINQIPGLGAQDHAGAAIGEDYLKTLPPGTAAQVKAIAEGRAALPPLGMRGVGAQLRDAVFKYDPNYSDQRAQIRKAFTTGKDGQNIGALNTASVHLDQLADAGEAMHNGSFVPGNATYNYFANMFGGAAPNNFESLKSAVAGEMANALKGTATDVEIANISHNIMTASSPEQLRGAVETNLHTLGAKLRTYQERYRQQIPDDTAWSPVLPSVRAIYQKHGFDPLAASRQFKHYAKDAKGNRVGSDDGKTWQPAQ